MPGFAYCPAVEPHPRHAWHDLDGWEHICQGSIDETVTVDVNRIRAEERERCAREAGAVRQVDAFTRPQDEAARRIRRLGDVREETPAGKVRLRTGRKVGRTIYIQHGSGPSDDDMFIGCVDTPELAAEICARYNREES